jgi:hypothetical protein
MPMPLTWHRAAERMIHLSASVPKCFKLFRNCSTFSAQRHSRKSAGIKNPVRPFSRMDEPLSRFSGVYVVKGRNKQRSR